MAILSIKNKYCFIHIPRTGGTTIKTLLSEIDADVIDVIRQDATIKEVMDGFPDAKDYYKFSYVRHPYDWIVSLFSCIHNNIGHPDYKIVKGLTLLDFIHWINDVGLKRKPEGGLPVYRKQTDYLFINKELAVDYVYKFQFMCDDMSTSNINTLFLKLGFDMPSRVPVLNKSHRSISWEHLFNDKAYTLMNRVFLDDFVNFKFPRKDVR
jgi:hypothetical protein